MRITKRTELAMRVLMFCAVNSERNVTKTDVAEGCNSSPNHLGHVVNRLGQLGFLATTRGRRGGIRLARPASEIGVGDVFRQLEREMPVVECMEAQDNTCPLMGVCRLQGAIDRAVEAFYAALDEVTLDQLVASNTGLCRILRLSAAE